MALRIDVGTWDVGTEFWMYNLPTTEIVRWRIATRDEHGGMELQRVDDEKKWMVTCPCVMNPYLNDEKGCSVHGWPYGDPRVDVLPTVRVQCLGHQGRTLDQWIRQKYREVSCTPVWISAIVVGCASLAYVFN